MNTKTKIALGLGSLGFIAASRVVYNVKLKQIHKNTQKGLHDYRRNITQNHHHDFYKQISLKLKSYSKEEGTDSTTFLVFSDLHCNLHLANMIPTIAESFDVDAVINLGDMMLTGEKHETCVVDSIIDGLDEIPVVHVLGNHDETDICASIEKKHNHKILRNEVISIGGANILGSSEQHLRKSFKHFLKNRRNVTELARKAAEVAENHGEVHLHAVHQPKVGKFTMRRRLIPFKISGHYHWRVNPHKYRLFTGGVSYALGASSGAGLFGCSMKPVRATAQFTFLKFCRKSEKFSEWRLLKIKASGEIKLSEWRDLKVQETLTY